MGIRVGGRVRVRVGGTVWARVEGKAAVKVEGRVRVVGGGMGVRGVRVSGVCWAFAVTSPGSSTR